MRVLTFLPHKQTKMEWMNNKLDNVDNMPDLEQIISTLQSIANNVTRDIESTWKVDETLLSARGNITITSGQEISELIDGTECKWYTCKITSYWYEIWNLSILYNPNTCAYILDWPFLDGIRNPLNSTITTFTSDNLNALWKESEKYIRFWNILNRCLRKAVSASDDREHWNKTKDLDLSKGGLTEVVKKIGTWLDREIIKGKEVQWRNQEKVFYYSSDWPVMGIFINDWHVNDTRLLSYDQLEPYIDKKILKWSNIAVYLNNQWNTLYRSKKIQELKKEIEVERND